MRLLRDQVCIRPEEEESDYKSESGIFLPAGQQSQWAYAEVVALGEYVQRYNDGSIEGFPYNVGDRVLYAKHAPTDFDLDGDKSVKLVLANAIYGVCETQLAVV